MRIVRDYPSSECPEIAVALSRLSHRQRSVLFLICKGLRNREIADHLCLSPRIVKACTHELLLLFDVSNRTELVGSMALEGLSIPPPHAEDIPVGRPNGTGQPGRPAGHCVANRNAPNLSKAAPRGRSEAPASATGRGESSNTEVEE